MAVGTPRTVNEREVTLEAFVLRQHFDQWVRIFLRRITGLHAYKELDELILSDVRRLTKTKEIVASERPVLGPPFEAILRDWIQDGGFVESQEPRVVDFRSSMNRSEERGHASPASKRCD